MHHAAAAPVATLPPQAQIDFADEQDTLAIDRHTEAGNPTAATHLLFEQDAAVIWTEAEALMPTVNAQDQANLRQWITVADLLTPGPGYGTTAEDTSAWDAAVAGSSWLP